VRRFSILDCGIFDWLRRALAAVGDQQLFELLAIPSKDSTMTGKGSRTFHQSRIPQLRIDNSHD